MQQINLYQEVFRKREQPLSARQLLWTTAGLLVLLSMMSTFRYWQVTNVENQLKQAKTELQQSVQQLTVARDRHQRRQSNPQLIARIETLQKEINTRQQVLRVLSTRQFGNTRGFAEQVSGLARQRIEGMWLTSLHISQGGVKLGMQGNALRAELLPQYLQRLGNEQVFSGTEFATFLMQRQETAPYWIEFNLESVDQAESS